MIFIKNKIIKLTVSIILVIFIAYFSTLKFIRFDLTSEGRYTLTDYTKDILEELDDIVYIKVYLDGKDLPISFKKMQQAVMEELEEFKVYGGNNIEYEFVNPSESTDKEIRFGLYKQLSEKGIFPIETQELNNEGKTSLKMVFPGATINYKGKEKGINLLKNLPGVPSENELTINSSIQSLEYEFINAIKKLSRKNKPEIAFIEGQNELSELYVFDIQKSLGEYYDVKRGNINARPGVLDNFKAIIIAKPRKAFTEQDKFVIDQYIMNGGNVLWLVEGTNTNMDSLFLKSRTMAVGQDINLNDMLFKYGARVNHNLLMDKQSSSINLPDRRGQIKPYPWYYFPVIVTDNNHVISKYLDFVKTEFVCTVDTVGEDTDIKKTVLLQSSKLSKIETIPVIISLDMVNNMPSDEELKFGRKNIAVLLEGRFKSVFANRNFKKFFPEYPDIKIREIGKPSKMIVVGDGDIIKNEVSSKGEPYPIGFDKFTRHTFNGNKEFIINAVNYLCNDSRLMTIRSRELKLRLLNKEEIEDNRLLIQIVNTILPIFFIVLFGITVRIFRKMKYTKD